MDQILAIASRWPKNMDIKNSGAEPFRVDADRNGDNGVRGYSNYSRQAAKP